MGTQSLSICIIKYTGITGIRNKYSRSVYTFIFIHVINGRPLLKRMSFFKQIF